MVEFSMQNPVLIAQPQQPRPAPQIPAQKPSPPPATIPEIPGLDGKT
jgi:hypothetical protein